ncbi:DUF1080 domain-containing protein [Cyanobium sp. FGCU-6]|nr:DUF1080 domain-containing protein [Cyanobium sp. FGCU6]
MPTPDQLPNLDESQSNRIAVQRTTLSLDALGRFVCNRLEEALDPSKPGMPTDLASNAASNFVSDFDAIVIGSGMYGAYAAQQLYRRGAKVLVLEAGPFLISEHYQNLSIRAFGDGGLAFPDDENALNQTTNLVWGQPWRGNQIFRRLAYCVGGKSLFWGGWAPKFKDDELDGPLKPGGLPWPKLFVDYYRSPEGYDKTALQIGVSELLPQPGGNPSIAEIYTDFFSSESNILNKKIREKAKAKIDGTTFSVFHSDTPGSRFNTSVDGFEPAPIAVQANAPGSGLFSFDKFSSLPLLIQSQREDAALSLNSDQRRRLFIIPNVRVLELRTVAEGAGNRVSEVILNDRPSIPVNAKCQVILALSSIESTALSLNSFGGIAPLNNLMGRNLMAHIRNNFTVRIKRSVLGLEPDDQLQVTAFHITCKASTGGRYHIQLYASSTPGKDGENYLYSMVTDTDVLQGLLNNQDPDWVALTFRGCGEMLGLPGLDQPRGANGASYIEPSNEFFDLGRPRGQVNFFQEPDDKSVFDEMDQAIFNISLELAKDKDNGDKTDGNIQYWVDGIWQSTNPFAFGEPRFGKLAKEQGENGIRDGLGTTWHESGTLWMGDNPNTSVTNPYGQFHQVQNAWCVDQAVFPRCGSVNPVPVGLTIARFAAEKITELPPDDPGFEPLFKFQSDSSLLPQGWKHLGPGQFNRFGDVLETNNEGIGLLYYEAEGFKDFTLRLQWRSLTIQNNSGVYIRLPAVLVDGVFQLRDKNNINKAIKTGYEIQIDATGDREDVTFAGVKLPREFFNKNHMTGAIYPVDDPTGEISPLPSPNGRPVIQSVPSRKLEEWNDMEILVGGNRIRVILNGIEVLEGGDYVDMNNAYPEGLIALQTHFKGNRVQFRHLRIKNEVPTF